MKSLIQKNDRFHDLEFIDNDVPTLGNLGKKFKFKCKCGREVYTILKDVIRGHSKSCGKCNYINLEHGSKLGFFIYQGEAIDIAPNSCKRVTVLCKCGKIHSSRFSHIHSGLTKSCGKCNTIQLHSGDKINNFIYVGNNISVNKGGIDKLRVQCLCGNITENVAYQLFSNKSKSCGSCRKIWIKRNDSCGSFVYIGDDIFVSPRSFKKYLFKCKCGNEKFISLCHVMSGHTKKCGNCRSRVKKWYEDNKQSIKSLTCPINPENFILNGVTPLEIIESTRKPFRALCPACGQEYYPCLDSIKLGVSLTCGCSNSRISSGHQEISDFLKTLNIHHSIEYKLMGKIFDIFIPSKNLLIEFNGLKWHSFQDSRERDNNKYYIAIKNGYSYMCIYEDEWRKKKSVFKHMIANRIIDKKEVISLRPSKCQIKKINNEVTNQLYEEFHYIGKCNSSYNYGVYFNGNLIGCSSFRRPSRQSINASYEISRMVMDPSFRVHGIWSKILKIFIQEHDPDSIVSYSDNRLFTGSVYEKMGFVCDGFVKPDYYWVYGGTRFHKSKLRKPKHCIETETKLRESEGYKKIWDLGKKRWILRLKPEYPMK